MLKKLLFSLLVVTSFFVLVEIILALAGVDPIACQDDPFVGFSSQAPLFVEQRESNGRVVMMTAPNKLRWFNLQKFPRHKPDNTYRIFCLGGSTTYGHPYADSTSFCGWLRELLSEADPTQTWEVINAGGISYASYRIVKIAEELAGYEPDLFVVYTGHNEFLEERTYRAMKRMPLWLRNLGAIFSRTHIYAAIHHLTQIGRPPAQADHPQLKEEVHTRLDDGVGPDAFQRDESLASSILEHFRFNLQQMIRIARNAGAGILLVTPSSNLADCSPFKAQHRDGLTELERQRWEAAVDRARQAMARGDFDVALRQVEQAALIDARSANLHYLRGQVLQQLKRYADAKTAFQRARDEDVCPLRATSAIVRTVRDVAADLDVPLVDFQRQVDEHSDHGIPGDTLFLDHVHPTIEGNRMLALAIMERMEELKIWAPGDTWGDAAIERVTERVEGKLSRRDHGIALRNLAKVFTWAGKDDLANRLALRAAPMVEGDAESYYLAANALLEKGEVQAAVEQLRHALRIDPNYVQALNSLGSAFHRLGRLDDAITQYRRVVELQPDFAPVHNNLGALYQRQSQFDLAVHHYSEAIRLNPRYSTAYNNLSVVQRKQGRLNDAEQSCLKALTINPKFTEAHFNLGLVRSAQQRTDEAIQAFREALRIDPTYGPAYYGWGLELEQRGDLRTAALRYREAMNHSGTPIDAACRLAWICATAMDESLRNGRLSLQIAQRCAQATRFSDAASLSALAAAYAETGDFDQAVKWQSEALRRAAPGLHHQHQARLERLRRHRPLRGASGIED